MKKKKKKRNSKIKFRNNLSNRVYPSLTSIQSQKNRRKRRENRGEGRGIMKNNAGGKNLKRIGRLRRG